MEIIFLYAIIYFVFMINDLIPLYRNHQIKLLFFNSCLLLLGFVILTLMVLDVEIPSPAVPIKNAVTTLFGQEK